ncbi:MAG: hypothetical protein KF816_15590 [Melioribacteraceae bacterium]|jgi:hypothetical protein|nr:hypothetical protein [Melioribacteraceae bacterium]
MKKCIGAVLCLILFVASSCNKDDATGPEDGIKKLTVTHWGVDWSEGKVGTQGNEVEWEKSDGETISWCAYGSSQSSGNGVWFRPYVDKLKKLSTSDLSAASLADTTNWLTDVCSQPLQNGQIWMAKCRDGYVVFRVAKQPDINAQFWPVEVEYRYFKK